MTRLTRPISRATERRYSVLYSKARPIVVTLRPLNSDDVLEFRELGRRQRWYLSVEDGFRHAVHLASQAVAAERRRTKKGHL